jgi:hypothetical protein
MKRGNHGSDFAKATTDKRHEIHGRKKVDLEI